MEASWGKNLLNRLKEEEDNSFRGNFRDTSESKIDTPFHIRKIIYNAFKARLNQLRYFLHLHCHF